jgi:membrane protease YdiL (CAAX protease family)
MRIASLRAFFAITFGLTWGIASLLILFPDQLTAIFGELGITNPLFIIAVYAPAIAALILVMRHSGLTGLRRFLSRLALLKCPWGWYIFLLAGIPLLFYAGAALKGNLTFAATDIPISETLAAIGFMFVLGPVEELGWRGVALPLLQQRYTPIWSGLILGLIWGIWHLPAFYLSGTPQSDWAFLPFLIAATAICVIMTPLFNSSGGSLILPMLMHWQLNNPIFPDAQPYDTIVFVAAAVVVVILNRRRMFTRAGSVTTVVP